jgi:hypothetical protein
LYFGSLSLGDAEGPPKVRALVRHASEQADAPMQARASQSASRRDEVESDVPLWVEALPRPAHRTVEALPQPAHRAVEALPQPAHRAVEALPRPAQRAVEALPQPSSRAVEPLPQPVSRAVEPLEVVVQAEEQKPLPAPAVRSERRLRRAFERPRSKGRKSVPPSDSPFRAGLPPEVEEF